MELIAWLAAGTLAFMLARLLKPAEDPLALAPTILTGVAGAVLGGALSSLISHGDGPEVGLRTVIFATIGSTLAMAIFRVFRKRD